MPKRNEGRPRDPAPPSTSAPSGQPTARAPKPPAAAPDPAPYPADTDSLKTQMPTGEVGVRSEPGLALASDSGGTSKAEDTPRAAGYVADLTRTNVPPPGPPVPKSPENFAGPESETVSPKPRVPTGTTGAGSAPPARSPAPSKLPPPPPKR